MFIGDRDTHLVIEKMKDRVDHLPNYTFKYNMENGEIRHMFWADEISKINYQAFGDVLAFDATYQTNKYNLIFVPFTGVDNNKRCVTFGAGLLFCETIEAYTWLLRAFLEAHNKQPTLVLTDQDLVMRQAVAAVFDRSLHRLCMWHIMKKLPAKITGEVAHYTEFRAAIDKLVWNIYIKPETFERRWGKLLEKYGLEDHEWLRDMFNIKEVWVPAYFREILMSCLMKTTSRCESSNSAFKVNSSWANTLVQFFFCVTTPRWSPNDTGRGSGTSRRMIARTSSSRVWR
ncbi:putative MULE transposase domain, FHY3/FAR1 family [Helianthus annuus]|nr:putative MULE transposase domain, FHY3/FAR1 family [Helianthus annuus]